MRAAVHSPFFSPTTHCAGILLSDLATIRSTMLWLGVRLCCSNGIIRTEPATRPGYPGRRARHSTLGRTAPRIGIARALCHDPAVLVLDEATSSLDTATERDVMDAVRNLQGDKTLLIVAHHLSTAEHCDRLYWLYQGGVIKEGAWGRYCR